MDDAEKLRTYVELWKQTIDVQKHFNDIEMRIRALALTVLTFALGAAAVAIKDGTRVTVLRGHIELAALILFLSAVLWLIFYFVDQIWYHRLLIGAVVHGESLEAEIAKLIPLGGDDNKTGLTKQIHESSPYRLFGKDLHSKAKIRIFYWSVGALLIIFGCLALTSEKQPTTTPTHPVSTSNTVSQTPSPTATQ
jgi:hypothetical protein